MKKVLLGLLVITSLTACNKKEEKETTIDVPQLNTSPSPIEAASASSSQPSIYTTPEIQQPVAATAGGRINPPHGEPGHLCEYEVGAMIPANVAASTAQPVVTPAPQPVVTSAPPRPTPINPGIGSALSTPLNTVVPTGPKPKLNPAHGMPWHDCAIEVGAPLN
jgi:hypothetical protein